VLAPVYRRAVAKAHGDARTSTRLASPAAEPLRLGVIRGTIVLVTGEKQSLEDTNAQLRARTVVGHSSIAELEALRRLAKLVAEGIEPGDLFTLVASEVAQVVGVPIVGIVRYEPYETATQCASIMPEGPLRPLGRRWSLEGVNVLKLVRERAKPARIDDYSLLEGEIADTLRRREVRASVASPIIVEGRLWAQWSYLTERRCHLIRRNV
jgi:GAF domain